MDGLSMACGRRGTGALFDEDFDAPDAPEPEVIAPDLAPCGLTEADLATARADAWAEGHASGRADAEAATTRALAQAAASLAAELARLRPELLAQAEAAADALARLLLDTLAVLFPALSARHGPAEARAVLRALLPGLKLEPEIVARANPDTAPALVEEITRALPDEAGRVRVVADPAMGPGDVRVRWQGGTAVRDGAALWEEVAAALAPAGLLSARVREIEHVE
jgi:flagellar assembly protein FliH